MFAKVSIQMTYSSNTLSGGKSSTWTCSAFMKILLLTLTIYPSKAADSRDKKNETSSKKPGCHQGYGCFKNEPPFNPEITVLPSSEEELGTKFLLRTQENKDDYEITNKSDIAKSTFKASRKTKVLIHGYVISKTATEIASWVPTMTDVLLRNDDVNVIIVDWFKGAQVYYDQAAVNTRMVGAQIHKLIMYLIKNHGAKAKDFHLIGFSLGSHVAGYAGKRMNKSHRRLGRITGLDPASPNFDYNSTEVRLDRSDARFVDVLHTDIRTGHIAFGMNRSVGHIDFWPNGADEQPGCEPSWFLDFSKTSCDHERAAELYTASITTKLPMYGYRCNDYSSFKRGRCYNCRGKYDEKKQIWKNNRCGVMGHWAQRPRGNRKNSDLNYYLDTSGKTPYAVRPYQVIIHFRKVAGKTTEGGHLASLFIRLHGNYRSESHQLYLPEEISTKYHHVKEGTTARFVINLTDDEGLGDLKKVTFWWQHKSCYNFMMGCNNNENIFVKRIRIHDVVEQKRYTFITPERLEHEPVAPKEILPNDKVEFVLREQQPKHKNSRRGRKGSKKGDILKKATLP